jgi:TatD DNase family protein
MIDTHSHLYSSEFAEDMEAIIARGVEAGVICSFLPAIDSSTHRAMMDLEERFPGRCRAMIGLHPCSVKENVEEELNLIRNLLNKRSFAAIGETGLDFYWDKTFVKEQYHALEVQTEWALSRNLPLILHTRNATQETIDVIRNFSGKGLTGIFHCFVGTLSEAEQIIDLGFLLGIGGVVTFKNGGLQDVLPHIALESIVLETDAPYLAPVPYRGKRNETSYLPFISKRIAEIMQIDESLVQEVTTANARILFDYHD